MFLPRTVALGFILALAASTASAQTVRLRGTIDKVEGLTLSITTRDGTPQKVVLPDNVLIVAVEKRSLTDIKPGEFVGSAATMIGDTWRALEVHIFPESMRGTGEGHRPWELPQSSMTNATVVDTVSKMDGHTMTLRYKDGEQRIVIADDTPIVGYVVGNKDDLKPGRAFTIIAATRAEDGSFRAGRITVERSARPPT